MDIRRAAWLPAAVVAATVACCRGGEAADDIVDAASDPVCDVASDSACDPVPDAVTADVCAVAAARLGFLPCTLAVPDEAAFLEFAVPDPQWPELRRALKFLLPADPEATLPAVFQDTRRFPVHYDFLVAVFPERFGSLSPSGYLALALVPATRQYWAGILLQIQAADGPRFGFQLYSDPDEVSLTDVQAVYLALKEVFGPSPLVYAPGTAAQAAGARSWEDPGFPIYIGSWLGG